MNRHTHTCTYADSTSNLTHSGDQRYRSGLPSNEVHNGPNLIRGGCRDNHICRLVPLHRIIWLRRQPERTRALDGVAIEQDGQKYFVGQSSAKLLNSTGQIRAANENYCRSPEYAALFKGALWHIARHHRVTGSLVIKHLVVGLPMTTVYENTDFLESLCIGIHDLPCINDTAGSLKVCLLYTSLDALRAHVQLFLHSEENLRALSVVT